ncbi:AraC family transcriptional regulator [Lachnospiraceae bacterium 54-53]
MSNHIFNYSECQDLLLIEIGSEKCTPLYSFGPFIRNEYIFHYVISGKGYFSKFDHSRTMEVKAGEGFLVEPHCKHIYYADEKNPWHYIWVVFKGLLIPQYLRSCGISKEAPIYRPKNYDLQTTHKIKEHLIAILDAPDSSKPYILAHFHLFFDALIKNAAIVELPAATDSPLTNFYISEALRYIQFHYQDIKSLDEISRFCNVSRNHLTRLFQKKYHTTLQDFLIQYRLNKAQDLLVNSNLSISEIAFRIGYQNELNFLRAFKKKYEMPPSQWRNKNVL